MRKLLVLLALAPLAAGCSSSAPSTSGPKTEPNPTSTGSSKPPPPPPTTTNMPPPPT